MTTTRRRNVLLSPRAPRRGRPRLWAYGYADIAAMAGKTEVAVRKAAERGVFDPSDLLSVAAYVHRSKETTT